MLDLHDRSQRRKASMETRQGLLRALSVPAGVANVGRQPGKQGDRLVVTLVSKRWLPADPRIDEFDGFPVVYEVVRPLKVGAR
jgi:hypothetical protein